MPMMVTVMIMWQKCKTNDGADYNPTECPYLSQKLQIPNSPAKNNPSDDEGDGDNDDGYGDDDGDGDVVEMQN